MLLVSVHVTTLDPASAATVEAAALVERVEAELFANAAGDEQARRGAATFRAVAVAADFLAHREHVKGSRPSTLADYRSMRAEPGVPLKRRFAKDRRRRSFGLNYSAHRVVKATEVAVVSDALPDIFEGWD